MDHVVYTQHFTHLEAAHTGGTSPADPDTLEVFTEIIDTIGPCHVLEIGMNQGGSALAFLLCGCSVTSIDPTHKPVSVSYLQSIFDDQFSYYNIMSGELDKVPVQQYGLAFIDGDHSSPQVDQDADKCIQLGIPYLLFDDTRHEGHRNIRECIDRGVADDKWRVIAEYMANCGKTLVQVL